MKLNDTNLSTILGGADDIVGVSTPLGEYSAEQLIDMYNSNPSSAASFIGLAKAFYPDLIPQFIAECEAKKLAIPAGLLALIR